MQRIDTGILPRFQEKMDQSFVKKSVLLGVRSFSPMHDAIQKNCSFDRPSIKV